MIPLGVLASGYVAPAGGGGIPVDPSTLSSRAWCIDASDLGTEFSAVASWYDHLQPSNFLFTQSNGSSQPTVQIVGGTKVARFDADDSMPTTDLKLYNLSNTQTHFAVVRVAALTNDRLIYADGTGVALGINSNGTGRMFVRGGAWETVSTSGTFVTDEWVLVSGRYNQPSGNMAVRLNAEIFNSVPATSGLSYDRRNSLSSMASCDVAEMWVFNQALGDADWDGVCAYFVNKYGIT